MNKIKRKQIYYEGNENQYIKGNGELGEFNEPTVIITLTSIANSIDEISNETLTCDKTPEEIYNAYNSEKAIEWRLVLSNDSFVYKLEEESFNRVELVGYRTMIHDILYYNNFNTNHYLYISCRLMVSQNDEEVHILFNNTANCSVNIVRSIDNEPLLPSYNGNISVHDGFYFPNAIQDYDGNWYGAVVIGDQVWLAENLKTTHYFNGTSIPYGGTTHSRTSPYYYHPDGNAENDEVYGLLYNLEAAIQYPFFENWHVPSSGELDVLYNYVNKQRRYTVNDFGDRSAKAYASTAYWNDSDTENTPGNNKSTNNTTGFNAIPAGSFYTNRSVGSFFCMWSSSKQTINLIPGAVCHYFANNSSRVDNIHRLDADGGYSIRCVSDLNPIQFRDWYIKQYGSLQHHLTQNFEVDNVPTEDSTNLITSGAVYEALHSYENEDEPTPTNNAVLNINVNDEEFTSFSSDQELDVDIDFEAGVGITIEGDEENGIITISSESNHTVVDKQLIVTGQQGTSAYYYNVRCDLNGSILKVGNLTDFCTKNKAYSYENNYVWTKTANETGVYAGLCKVKSTEGKFVFKIDIYDSINDKTTTHYFGLLVDSPSDATFTFVTTCPWDIIVRINSGNTYLLGYLEIPDEFVGTITLTPLRYNFSSGNNISSFDATSTYYGWGNEISGGTQNMNTVTTLTDNEPTSSGTNKVRTPMGNYYVNVMGDFGVIDEGSKISDSVVNDYYLHTLEKRVQWCIDQYNILQQSTASKASLFTLLGIPEPNEHDAGKVLAVNVHGDYELVTLNS